jgi:hypothetical protein
MTPVEERLTSIDRAQQIGAVVGEAPVRPLVEPAKCQEVGGIAGRAGALPVLDLDREREHRRRPHRDHAEPERHAGMGVADARRGADDFDVDRHRRGCDRALC